MRNRQMFKKSLKHKKIKNQTVKNKQTVKKQISKKQMSKKQMSKKQVSKKYNHLKGGGIEDIKPLLTFLKSQVQIITIDINDFSNQRALACICQDRDIAQQVLDYIRRFAKENGLRIKEQDTFAAGKLFVWIFAGMQILFENPDGHIYYSISVEYDDCFNFAEAKTTYFEKVTSKAGNTEWQLNLFGYLVFNCLLKYTQSFDISSSVLNRVYNKDRQVFLGDPESGAQQFIELMVRTRTIFEHCNLFYSGVAGNILKELFKYANPEIIETTERYDNIETEINSLVLETPIRSPDGNVYNFRTMLNMLIVSINRTLADRGVCAKSGGEVFRYYGEDTPYTNDIDTKVFLSETLSDAEISDIELTILNKLITLNVFIAEQNLMINARPPEHKKFQLGQLQFILEFLPFQILFTDQAFASRVRSKIVGGHRLDSLDVFLAARITMEKASPDALYVFNTQFSASPFDCCFYEPKPAAYLDIQTNTLKYTEVMSLETANAKNDIRQTSCPSKLTDPRAFAAAAAAFAQGAPPIAPAPVCTTSMPIMSKGYLLLDILYILDNGNRPNKRNKDLKRLVFLLNIDSEATANVILRDIDMKFGLGRRSSVGIKSVKELTDFLRTEGIEFQEKLDTSRLPLLNMGCEMCTEFEQILHDTFERQRDLITVQVEMMRPTVVRRVIEGGTIEISSEACKTSMAAARLYEKEDYDNMDYNG